MRIGGQSALRPAAHRGGIRTAERTSKRTPKAGFPAMQVLPSRKSALQSAEKSAIPEPHIERDRRFPTAARRRCPARPVSRPASTEPSAVTTPPSCAAQCHQHAQAIIVDTPCWRWMQRSGTRHACAGGTLRCSTATAPRTVRPARICQGCRPSTGRPPRISNPDGLNPEDACAKQLAACW